MPAGQNPAGNGGLYGAVSNSRRYTFTGVNGISRKMWPNDQNGENCRYHQPTNNSATSFKHHDEPP